MTPQTHPRSPKQLLGGFAHLARLIDKIRLRHAGFIPDYNYLTAGFDKYLLEFLHLNPKTFEQRVLQGGTDEELLDWVRMRSRSVSDEEIARWSRELLERAPMDDEGRRRFRARLLEIAAKRGVPVDSLPPVRTWADVIELDEGRL